MIDPKRLAYIEKRFNHNRQAIIDILELSDEWMRKDSDHILVPWNIIAEAAHLFDEQGWTSRGDECRTLLHGPAPTPLPDREPERQAAKPKVDVVTVAVIAKVLKDCMRCYTESWLRDTSEKIAATIARGEKRVES